MRTVNDHWVAYVDDALVANFWSHVDRREDSDCWQWTAGQNSTGYGRIGWARRGVHFWAMAHRLSLYLAQGYLTPGLVIDHLCRNRLCVNPAHLQEVKHRINTLRGVGATAIHARQTHCIHGHEFTPENTYVPPKRPRSRLCVECRRENDRRATLRKQEARRAA